MGLIEGIFFIGAMPVLVMCDVLLLSSLAGRLGAV